VQYVLLYFDTDQYLMGMAGIEKHVRPLLKADRLASSPHVLTDVPKKHDW